MPKRLNRRARAPIPIPDIPDEIFYKVKFHLFALYKLFFFYSVLLKELCYTKHEDEIIGKKKGYFS